jgi:hypothetical protein|eukprot:Transcript_10494.p2 GENE.Transcript_10494~~Transcript_10494.p2  ORF type:complete len:133 (-),score=56.17 Transcript_10494:53-451(-)
MHAQTMIRAAARFGSMAQQQQQQPVRIATRSLAKKAKKGDEAAKPARRAADASTSSTVAGLNILKDGQEVELKPDEEYPEWVWKLHEPRPTLQQLRARHEADPESLTPLEQKKLAKLWNRARIKENNAELKK